MNKTERQAAEQELRELRRQLAERDMQIVMQDTRTLYQMCRYAQVKRLTTEILAESGLDESDRADIVAITGPVLRLMKKLAASSAARVALIKISNKTKGEA